MVTQGASTGIPVDANCVTKVLVGTKCAGRHGGTNAATVHSRQVKTAESIEKEGRERQRRHLRVNRGVMCPPPKKWTIC